MNKMAFKKIDHVRTTQSHSSIIRNGKCERLSKYIALVNFEKAFDWEERNLLFFKLKSMGFDGKKLRAIKSIYQ